MNTIRDNFGWIKDLAMVVGMCGVLYLNLNYVTTTKFEAFTSNNEKRFENVQSAIISLDKSLSLLQQNNAMLLTAQNQIIHINEVLNDVTQQNKIDSQINTEYKEFNIKVSDHLKLLDLKDASSEYRLASLEKFMENLRKQSDVNTDKPSK